MYKLLLNECEKAAPITPICECNPYSYPDFKPCKHSSTLKDEMSEWLPIIRRFYDVKEKAEAKILQQAIEAEIGHTTNFIDPIKEKIARHQNNLYYWICVAPGSPPFGSRGLSLDDFVAAVEKFINRRCVTSGIACIEQKGKYELERGLHPHAHILVRRDLNCPPKTLIFKNLVSSFSRFFKKQPVPVRSNGPLQYNPCPQKFIIDKINYIKTGGKTGDGKDICQLQDVIWRKENNFSTFWLNGELGDRLNDSLISDAFSELPF